MSKRSLKGPLQLLLGGRKDLVGLAPGGCMTPPQGVETKFALK